MNLRKFLDILRCKIKYIEGKNNKIYNLCKNKAHFIKYIPKNSKLEIMGNNNTIIFNCEHHTSDFPVGLFIDIEGDNNFICIEKPNFKQTRISMEKDNNVFKLKYTFKKVTGATFFIEDGGIIEIEDNCEIGNGNLYVVVNGDYKNKHKLLIKQGTHIARDAIIRTSDGECLLDSNTKEPISEPQDIVIGEHCWITSRCTILKGAILPAGTVVASNSLVNKRFEDKNTIIGGVPASIIRRNVTWVSGSYAMNMKQKER